MVRTKEKTGRGKVAAAREATAHTGFRFPLTLIRAMDCVAAAENVTRTEAIRRAIVFYVKTKGINAPDVAPARPPGRPTIPR